MTQSFDDALNKHKSILSESLVNFDEGKRIRKILLDIDSNSADYEYYFQSGQQSKQDEIDELQKRINELELINFDSELHFDAAKEHIDDLQERIDEAIYDLQHIESVMWEEQVEHVLMILKG